MSENRTVKALHRPPMAGQPAIIEGGLGRMKLSGLPHGAYLKLAQLYSRILDASRIVERYAEDLRLMPDPELALVTKNALSTQDPLTPLEASRLVPHLYYKREDQTSTRAYKVRGALVGMAKVLENGRSNRFLTVSTGNHALGVLKAAELLRPASVRIVVPGNTVGRKLLKINAAIEHLQTRGVPATLERRGDTFDEARRWALRQQEVDTQTYYLDPYSDPWVVAGQGTLGLELVNQTARVLEQGDYREVVVIAPVGGGGLLSGTAAAMRMGSLWERAFRGVHLRFLGMRLQNLNAELGDAIRVSEVAAVNRNILGALNVPFRLMEDEDMLEGVRLVKRDIGQSVEGASAGAVYPALSSLAYKPDERRLVISILSGANIH